MKPIFKTVTKTSFCIGETLVDTVRLRANRKPNGATVHADNQSMQFLMSSAELLNEGVDIPECLQKAAIKAAKRFRVIE